jgi:hypothetical protein
MSQFKVTRLYEVIKWLVESDAASDWNHGTDEVKRNCTSMEKLRSWLPVKFL